MRKGKYFSEGIKKMTGLSLKRKTYEEIYGEEKAKLKRKICSKFFAHKIANVQ